MVPFYTISLVLVFATRSLGYLLGKMHLNLTYNTEGHGVPSRSMSVPDNYSVQACIFWDGLRDLHTALGPLPLNWYSWASYHHLNWKEVTRGFQKDEELWELVDTYGLTLKSYQSVRVLLCVYCKSSSRPQGERCSWTHSVVESAHPLEPQSSPVGRGMI